VQRRCLDECARCWSGPGSITGPYTRRVQRSTRCKWSWLAADRHGAVVEPLRQRAELSSPARRDRGPVRSARSKGHDSATRPAAPLAVVRAIIETSMTRAQPSAIPAVITRYFAAQSGRDFDAVVTLFAEDAVLIDEGQPRYGPTQIREWRDNVASLRVHDRTPRRAAHRPGRVRCSRAPRTQFPWPAPTAIASRLTGSRFDGLEIAP
jgi:hypothetical protein